MKPTGLASVSALGRRAVATFHASQQRNAAPPHLRALRTSGLAEDHAAETEGHQEHHHRHAETDSQETGQAAPHADLRPGGRQQHVARPGRAGRRNREDEEGDGLLPRHRRPFLRSRIDLPHGAHGRGIGPGGSCTIVRGGDWVTTSRPGEGVELLRAWFGGRAFARHRHDTYAIGVTEAGVQTFDYRGRVERSTPGQVVVLHPDEMHDGRAGTDPGFGYRIVYVDPARIAAAVRSITGRPTPLPFVPEPVSHNPTLARAVTAAFRCSPEPLALDALVLRLAEGLLDGNTRDRRAPNVTPPRPRRARAGPRIAGRSARRRPVGRARGGRGARPLRARASVPRLVWHEPLSLLADAAPRLSPGAGSATARRWPSWRWRRALPTRRTSPACSARPSG